MNEVDKLRVLLPHWIEHNGEHASEFRAWAERVGASAGPHGPLARDALSAAARLLEQANARLQEALEQIGGPLEHHPE